jgi:magnesium chelatase subunit I
VDIGPKDEPEVRVSAAEFILEGLHAHKRIGRTEERVFGAGEKHVRRAAAEPSFPDAPHREPRSRRGFN